MSMLVSDLAASIADFAAAAKSVGAILSGWSSRASLATFSLSLKWHISGCSTSAAGELGVKDPRSLKNAPRSRHSGGYGGRSLAVPRVILNDGRIVLLE
jgi:hypothetical protein